MCANSVPVITGNPPLTEAPYETYSANVEAIGYSGVDNSRARLWCSVSDKRFAVEDVVLWYDNLWQGQTMIRSLSDAEQFFEHVLRHLHPALTPEQHADVLQRLYWASEDPGGFLLAVRESWLRGDDRYRVEVALAFDEIFPFRERLEMEAVLERIGEQWPELARRCEALAASRKAQESEGDSRR